MVTIGLIRHGMTDWNKERRAQGQTDIPLNEDGMEQAKALAKRLVNEEWDLVVSSHLARAYETAKEVSEKLAIPLIEDSRLQEMSFGEVEGTTEKERVEKWGELWKQLDLGEEPREVVKERSLACVEEFCLKFPEKKLLFVSHGATLNQLMKGLLKDPSFDKGLHNTSLSIFTKEKENWNCSLLNCAKHLDEQLV